MREEPFEYAMKRPSVMKRRTACVRIMGRKRRMLAVARMRLHTLALHDALL